MSFHNALAFVLGPDIEGGFQNDPRDKGNWTSGVVGVGYMNGSKYGISAAAYPHLDILAMTLDDAKDIYRKDYWDKIQGDQLGKIDICIFDDCINQGPTRAIKLLQSALHLDMDGILGPNTFAALYKSDMNETIIQFTIKRIIDYTLCNGWSEYKGGWLHRAIKSAILSTNQE